MRHARAAAGAATAVACGITLDLFCMPAHVIELSDSIWRWAWLLLFPLLLLLLLAAGGGNQKSKTEVT